jgi:hypothetical protein
MFLKSRNHYHDFTGITTKRLALIGALAHVIIYFYLLYSTNERAYSRRIFAS